uniref:DAZ-associated protein 2 n=1 Tax=Leptobrachium leishanense TaxID=445787 RepID=A0A8C5MQC4_9ANUR
MNNKGQYPTPPAYPSQTQNPQSVYPQTMHLQQAPPYTDAPPAYSELYRPGYVHPSGANMASLSAAYPGTSMYLPMAQHMQVAPMTSSVPMAYYPIGPVYPPGSTVLVEGGFDARGQRLSHAEKRQLLHGRIGWRLHHVVKRTKRHGNMGGIKQKKSVLPYVNASRSFQEA